MVNKRSNSSPQPLMGPLKAFCENCPISFVSRETKKANDLTEYFSIWPLRNETTWLCNDA